MKTEIPEGYKNSPVGIIPEEWEVKRLEEIAEITSGATPSRKIADNWNGDIPWVTTSLLNNARILSAEEYITQTGLDYSATKILPLNTVLMAMYGEGQTRGKVSILRIEAATNQACAAIVVTENARYDYIFHQLTNMYNIIRNLSNDGSQKNLNLQLIKNIQVILPPLLEQQKIAEILSVWDVAIEKLTLLIEKLELRKRALMQQLLTGKKRLKGFDGEWKKVRLGEVSKIKKGRALSSTQTQIGIYPVIAGGKSSPYFHADFTDENVITVSASGAYAGYVAYHSFKIWASDCSVINEINLISDLTFLYYSLTLIQDSIYELQSGGAQPHVFPNDLKKIKIELPSLPEQTAITEILSTADQGIHVAKEKLEQLKKQKKGLMQVLLTGKKRVIITTNTQTNENIRNQKSIRAV